MTDIMALGALPAEKLAARDKPSLMSHYTYVHVSEG